MEDMHIWNNYYLLWHLEIKIRMTYSQKNVEKNRQNVADADTGTLKFYRFLPINRHILNISIS